MSYQIIRGSSKGFVSCVEKIRVRNPDGTTSVREKAGGRVCGLGNMTHEEFLAYKAWANSFGDQEERKAMVLSSSRAILSKKTTTKKVAAAAQAKTTVQRPLAVQKSKSDDEKQKERIRKHKEWFASLTDKQQKDYRERNRAELLLDQKELQEKFRKISKKDIKIDEQPVYKINDLIKAQKYEAEIKTLKGSDISRAGLRQGVIEREKKIRTILGDKYKTCEEIAIAANKGKVIIEE